MERNDKLMYLVPKKSLTSNTIVLDIDETLVHTDDENGKLNRSDVMNYPTLADDVYVITLKDDLEDSNDGNTIKMWGTKRPHLDEFLLFCFTYFDNVCVWSAGQYDYVHAMVNELFSRFRKPDIVMTFDDCVQNEEGDWIKPLEKFFNHPKAKGRIFPEDTYIIDDRNYTFERNKGNGILIPAYSPSSINDMQKEDDHLNRLKGWFMQPKSRFTGNVKTLNKNTIFKRTPNKYEKELTTNYDL